MITETLYGLFPPRTFSVGYEERIVTGTMFFTFEDPKIVVKLLFPFLHLKNNNNKSNPTAREWRFENTGSVFLLMFSKFLSESVSIFSSDPSIIYDKSQKSKFDSITKVGEIDLSKPFRSLLPTYHMIHNAKIERVRVPLIYYCPSSSILPIKSHYHKFFMSGVVTKS